MVRPSVAVQPVYLQNPMRKVKVRQFHPFFKDGVNVLRDIGAMVKRLALREYGYIIKAMVVLNDVVQVGVRFPAHVRQRYAWQVNRFPFVVYDAMVLVRLDPSQVLAIPSNDYLHC